MNVITFQIPAVRKNTNTDNLKPQIINMLFDRFDFLTADHFVFINVLPIVSLILLVVQTVFNGQSHFSLEYTAFSSQCTKCHYNLVHVS